MFQTRPKGPPPPPVEPCDVVLINPPWISKDQNMWHGIKAAMPPLSILTIAAALERQGVKVRVMDAHVNRMMADDVRRDLRIMRPKYVGITMLTATSVPSHNLARIVKEELPNTVVVVGGTHAEAMAAETLCNSAIDAVVRGDGEHTMWSIVQGHPFREILGISYRDGRTVIHNDPAPIILDLDSLPHPAYHLVPFEKYYPAIGAYKRLPAINMLMTRGCPGTCTFCNSAETTLRSRSADSVVDEIIRLKKVYGVREIQFFDDTFTVNRKTVERFCQLMVDKKVDVTFCCFARTDCFSEQMARDLKRAGCHQICFGIESGDDEILKNIRKAINRDRTRKAVALCRKAGIESRTSFILGNPGETLETMQRTLAFAIELDGDIALFQIATPYPGTQLFKWAKEHGYLRTEEWSEYELSTPILQLPTLNQQDLLAQYVKIHQAFYLRPRVIWRRIRAISDVRHLRDALLAFTFISMRKKLGIRRTVRADWVNHTKDEFFDFQVKEAPPLLTYQVHETILPPERLEPAAVAA